MAATARLGRAVASRFIAAFGAGALDLVDVDTGLLGLAHRRLGGAVLLRPLLAAFLAELHRRARISAR